MEKIESLIQELLKIVGRGSAREGLSKTPRRVAQTYAKMFAGYEEDPRDTFTVFPNEGYDEMIVISDIEWYSTCEHHLLPFFGKAHIGYLPDKKIAGLSKIPRIVDTYARRLQTQERLTSQIAHMLDELLAPKGVGVILEAQHLCMMARGVKKQGTRAITSAMLGTFKRDARTRGEFLQLIKKTA